MNQFSRTELLLGAEGMARLAASRVAIFGVGGMGGYAAEALVRSGLGAIDLFDDDRICLTNLNRQIIATRSTVGQYKVDATAQRLLDINPALRVETRKVFYMPDTAGEIDLRPYDYVVDAVDTVTAKLELIVRCNALGVRIISAMGAGNKLDPTKLRIADVYQTSMCPLARVMRHELAQARHSPPEGGLLHRAAPQDRRRSRAQLPLPLHLPAGHGAQVHGAPGHPRKHRLCAAGDGPDHRRGDRSGIDGAEILNLHLIFVQP